MVFGSVPLGSHTGGFWKSDRVVNDAFLRIKTSELTPNAMEFHQSTLGPTEKPCVRAWFTSLMSIILCSYSICICLLYCRFYDYVNCLYNVIAPCIHKTHRVFLPVSTPQGGEPSRGSVVASGLGFLRWWPTDQPILFGDWEELYGNDIANDCQW